MKRPRVASIVIAGDDVAFQRTAATPKKSRTQEQFDGSFLLAMDHEQQDPHTFDLNDWHALKVLHAQAIELYEGPNAFNALPVLRRVLRECERCLSIYPDPSVVYVPPLYSPQPSPPVSTPSLLPPHEWSPDEPISSPSSLLLAFEPTNDPSRPPEAITAFYTIYGSALFSFGTLILQDPGVVRPDEVPTPVYYFGRALDVMEMGENHPRRTKQDDAVPEDFLLALTSGRTLLYLAEERVNGQPQRTSRAFVDSLWPSDSPFAANFLLFPPRRLSLPRLGPSDILSLAVDELMRGFLHMPHTHRNSQPNSHSTSFPRCRTIFTIGSEMLRVASKLPVAADRKQWALWADRNAFAQMTFEPEVEQWGPRLLVARGKCCLLAAKASLHILNNELAAGAVDPDNVADCADELNKAVAHLQQALTYHANAAQEAQSLLAEAHDLLSAVPRQPLPPDSAMDVS